MSAKGPYKRVLYTGKRALNTSPIYPWKSPTPEPYFAAQDFYTRVLYIRKSALHNSSIYPPMSPT